MKSPFKFLDSYTKDDRDIFFGRDREIEELYQKVFESKMMLVYGVSGTGKSSLIHCGLANKFQETDWLPLIVRRGGNIIESTASVIKAASITPQDGQCVTPVQFKRAVRSLYLDHYKPVFFIFDQFEELFIFGDKDERKSFVQIIKTLVESDLQCRLIFVMREEYMAGVTEFERYIPTFFANRVRIEKMSHNNAIEAINGPCKSADITLEDGFSEALLERLCPEGADVELTYLQVFLDRIFRLATSIPPPSERAQGVSFTVSLLSRSGNVSDLLGRFLDEQIALLSNPDTALAVLKSFVSVRGTKRPMRTDDVKEYARTLGKSIEESELLEMVQTFIHLRILRDKDQDNRFELRHDALATKIYEKITLVEKELLEIRQLIENSYNNWLKRGVLISADDLQYIAPYESRLYLQAEFESLIDNSKKALVKSKQRRRNLLGAAAILLIVILGGFTFWAIKERANAIQKEKIANDAKIKATESEKEAIKARDNAIASDKRAVASEKEAIIALDQARESELRIKQEKELAVIRERQTRANNLNFLSKEVAAEDPTTALRLAEYALSLDPNNRSILSNIVKVYSENSFYKVFFRDKEGTNSQISPDWKRVITVYGRTARITDLNMKNSQLLFGHIFNFFSLDVHQISRRGFDNILSAAFSPDGKKVLTGSSDLTARLWDSDGNNIQIFKGHINYIRSVAFSPDGNTILTGSMDRSARLWDLDGKCLQLFNGHKLDILSVAFSPDGQTIITGSADSTARLWDLKGTTLKTFKGHNGIISKVVFAPDGRTILTTSSDQTTRLWDLEGNTLQIFTGHTDEVNTAVFSADGKTILTGSADKTARLWDLNGNSLQTFSGNNGSVISVSFSPDGTRILTFSTDGQGRIWDISQNASITFTGHKSYIYRAIFSPDGKTILTLSRDMTARSWDINGNALRTLKLISNSFAFSPDGKSILTGLWSAQLMDLDGNILQTFSGHSQPILSVAFSPDGKTVLTGSQDKSARLWDLNGKTIQIFNGHTDEISSVTFSPDGKTILTGSGDKTARLWDLKGNIIQTFVGHNNYINSVCFSPDGKTVLAGSVDKTAMLWDLTGNTLQIFIGHTDAVNSVAFSPDGKNILTGSGDKTARIWDLCGNTLQILTGYKNYIYAVAFSPDGKTVLTGSGDNTARLINVKIPLKQYLNENLCEGLRTDQKLNYEIIKIDMLRNEKDPGKLFNGMKFFISESKVQKDKKTEYLKNTEIIYRSLEKNITNTTDLRSSISYGIDLFRLMPQKYISDRIEKENQSFLSSASKEEIKETYEFYSDKCSYLDSVKVNLKLPECLIQSSAKLLAIDTTSRLSVSIDLACLSWPLLQNRKFKTSLDAITLAAEAKNNNPYVYTTLPLALVLNNRFDEASKIYLKYYKVYMLKNFNKSYKQIYLNDIADLEKQGITHPDFIKVKDLLNN